MKAIVTPPLTSQWWKANRPILLKSKDLENALVAYEKAHAAMGDPPKSHESIEAVKNALNGIDFAAGKAVADCNKVLKLGLKETVGTLRNYSRAVEAERQKLQGHRDAIDRVYADLARKYQELEKEAEPQLIDAEDIESRVSDLKRQVLAWAQTKDASAAASIRADAATLAKDLHDASNAVAVLSKQNTDLDKEWPEGFMTAKESAATRSVMKQANDFLGKAQGLLKIAEGNLGAIQKIVK